MIINDSWRNILRKLPTDSDYLPPINRHITPHFVHYDTGQLAFVIRMEGIPFDGVDDDHLFTQFNTLRDMFTGIGKSLGNRAAVWATLVRRKIDFNRQYRFTTQFCQDFSDKYLARFAEQNYFENVFYLTVLIKDADLDSAIKEAEDQSTMLMRLLEPYSPILLGTYRNDDGIWFSQVYEFFAELVNGRYERIPLATSMSVSEILASSVRHFGNDIAEIRPQNDVKKYAVMYDLKDFGISKPKIFTKILTLPCEFIFTQSMVFIPPFQMIHNIDKQINNLQSVGDAAEQQIREMEMGKGKLTSGDLMFGEYHAALTVYGSTPQEAHNNGARAASTFLNSGSYRFVKAGLSNAETFYSHIPGSKDKPRSFPKTSENLACTFGIHNYSHGKKEGNPLGDGSAVMPLQTVSKTIYDFNFHFSNPKEDNIGDKIAGHTMILGATGTGKTTLQCALVAFAERFNPHLFALDLDRGMEIFIRAVGGSYFALEAGVPTGLNPFQLPDTAGNREFLYSLVGICGQNEEGRLTAAEEKQIQEAVDATMELDWTMRRFSHMLQHIPMLPDPDCLYVRLAKWCESENGRFSWCLDNPQNLFNPENFWRIGFDLTDILQDDYPPTAPVLLYMFHLRNIMMDKVAEQNGLLATIFEEFWYAARFPITEDLLVKILKTDRKRGGWAILVSQSPADAIRSRSFDTIVEQTPTKIFLPNPSAKYEGSYELCGLTEKEFTELKKLSLDSRTFLVKQSQQSAQAMLDLYGFDREIAVLSGSSDNVELLHRVMAEYGEDVNNWYQPFCDLLAEKRERKRAKLLTG